MKVKQVKPVTMFIYEKLKSIGQLTLSIDEHLAFFVASVVALPGTALVLCAKLAMSALECVRYLLQSALDRVTSKKDSTKQFNYFVFSLNSNYRSTRETLYNLTYWPLIALFAIPSALTALTTTIVEICMKVGIHLATPTIERVTSWAKHDFIERCIASDFKRKHKPKQESKQKEGLSQELLEFFGVLVPSVFARHEDLMGTKKAFSVKADPGRFEIFLIGEDRAIRKINNQEAGMGDKLLNQNQNEGCSLQELKKGIKNEDTTTASKYVDILRKTSTINTTDPDNLKTWLYKAACSSDQELVREAYLCTTFWQNSTGYLKSGIKDALSRYEAKVDPTTYDTVKSEVNSIFQRMEQKASDCRKINKQVCDEDSYQKPYWKGSELMAQSWTEKRMIDWMREMQGISAGLKPIVEQMTRHATENDYEQWFYPNCEVFRPTVEYVHPNGSSKNSSPTGSVTSDESRSNNSFDSHTGRKP